MTVKDDFIEDSLKLEDEFQAAFGQGPISDDPVTIPGDPDDIIVSSREEVAIKYGKLYDTIRLNIHLVEGEIIVGPPEAVDGNIAVFNGPSGSVLKDVGYAPHEPHSNRTELDLITDAGSGLIITGTERTNWNDHIADDPDDHIQYHNDSRALTWLGTRSTSDLPEGSNLYYTEARVSANPDVAANTANRHSHSNKAFLDLIDQDVSAGASPTFNGLNISGIVSGDVDQVHFEARKGSVGTIPKGTPVYISGYNVGGWLQVEIADASDPAKMPAVAVTENELTISSTEFVALSGRLTGMDTSMYSTGDDLYVESGGGLTATKPTGTDAIQKIGQVGFANIAVGVMYLFGAGRQNDVPNIADNNVWLGNGSGVAIPTDIDTIIGANTDVAANTAYRGVGHLPLAGGTLTGSLALVADGVDNSLTLDNYSGINEVSGRRASGSESAPIATASGTNLLNLGGSGHNGTDFLGHNARIQFKSEELFTSIAHGTGIYFYTTALGATTRNQRMKISSDGIVNISQLTASQDVQTDGSKNLVSVSDMNWKNDLGLIENGIDIIKQIKSHYFNWKRDAENNTKDTIDNREEIDGYTKTDYKSLFEKQPRLAGFFAQEIHAVFPEGSPGGANIDENGDEHWGLNSRAILAVAIKAIQELDDRLKILENA